MTVKELIIRLQRLDQTRTIQFSGDYNCIGNDFKIEFIKDSCYVSENEPDCDYFLVGEVQ